MKKELSEKLIQTALIALRKTHQLYLSLGEQGREEVHKNQFGDTALRMDIEAEESIISTLKNSPITLHTEEHGILSLSQTPEYLGVIDGLDGSNVYKKDWKQGRFGTMLGIFSNTNPLYNDYLFSGVMEHVRGILYYAVKGKGAFKVENGITTPLHVSTTGHIYFGEKDFDDFGGDKMPILHALDGAETRVLGSTAMHYVDLAQGKASLVIECTRKGNLEIGAAYGLIKEAGGMVVTATGEEFGNLSFLTYGQKGCVPVISASSEMGMYDLLSRLGKNMNTKVF